MAGYYKKFKKDIRDIYEFYVDDETRSQVDSKGWAGRFFGRFYHVFKNFISKLNPLRKILFIVAIVFLLSNNDGDNNGVISAYILLFLLLLELKDKLLVRRELEAGRAVQEAMIPRNTPKISGWDIGLYSSPANDVGGDLVDYMNLDERKYLFALADIAGKGLGAALLTSKLQATMRAIASPDKSLVDTAQRLNKIFYRDVMKKDFATLIMLELDSESDQLHYINAGHLPPLKLTSSKVEEQEKGDPAIGLTANTKFNLQRMDLKKNEILLIYSDGITEAKRQDGIFFGDQNLYAILRKHQALPADKLCDEVVKSVREFLGEADQSDDISLLIIKKE